MKLRTKCKCGAEFEARGLVGNTAKLWHIWLATHNLVCMGIEKWSEEDGRIKLTPLSPDHAELMARPLSNSESENERS